jgi:hypothetical protein
MICAVSVGVLALGLASPAAAGASISVLNVNITGPAHIPAKALYTYTAETSYTFPLTYVWSERFCDSPGTSCTSWQTITGLQDTFNRVLGPDCSGSGNKTFEVRVVVHGGGTSGTDQKSISLCGVPL